MSKKSRLYVNISFLFITHCILSMDPPGDKTPPQETPKIYPQLTGSAGLAQQQNSSMNLSGSASSAGWLSDSNSSSWSFSPTNLFGGLISSVAGVASSATSTVYNMVSDDAALKKLGFPLNDSYAQSELAKCRQLYDDVLDSKKSQHHKEMLERILRRTEYLTRIFCILPDRPDFHEVILHGTENHSRAMSVFLKDCYDTFLKEKLALYNRLNEEIKQLNASQDHKPKLSVSVPSQGTETHSLQITIPTFSGATQLLCNSASSLYQTAINEFSDYAAFKKLGWPHNDPEAQQELQMTLDNYEKIMKVTNHQERADLLSFVLRRTEYLVRAFLALPQRSDKYELAQYLIKHHHRAMFPVLFTLFTRFTTNQRQAVQLAGDKILRNPDSIMVSNKIDFKFGTVKDKSAQEIRTSLEPASLILLKQIHAINGCVVAENNIGMEMFSQAGDFLVTNKPNVSLGILTADCLPIIFHDKKNHAIGIAHAGWRGSVGNIVKAVVECMQRNYDTQSDDLSIIFGPCIHQCCYQVGHDVITRVIAHGLADKTLIKRDNVYFFDLLKFNKELLLSLGVKNMAIDAQQSKCTACNTEYHSHRRQGEKAGRQLSLVWIT